MYSEDNLNTEKQKDIHSLIMEEASSIAEARTEEKWGETRANLFVEDSSGDLGFCEEGQHIFNDFYDEEMTNLYKFVNNIIKIHSK